MFGKSSLITSLIVVAAVIAQPAQAEAARFKVDPSHSTVAFKIRHLLTKVTGNFRQFEGTINYDAASPASSGVEFTIQAASIDTANEKRDAHLKSPDFFDVETIPTLSFRSTKVTKAGENALAVTGEFSLHGVTKTITVPVEVLGVMNGPWGPVAGFETSFTIDRKDYGIVWNKLLDQGGAVLGDEVEISIAVEAQGVKDEAVGEGSN